MAPHQYPPLELTDLSKVTHAYHGFFRPGETAMCALIVRFSGVYGHGSAGNADASYMTAILAAGLEAWRPEGLVLDLRELKYSWGDRIESVLGIGRGKRSALEAIFMGKKTDLKDSDIPTALVVSDLCRDGLESLIRQEMGEEPDRWMFDNLESAIAAVEKSQT